jgi:predicted DNA-binding WGR domain protein
MYFNEENEAKIAAEKVLLAKKRKGYEERLCA